MWPFNALANWWLPQAVEVPKPSDNAEPESGEVTGRQDIFPYGPVGSGMSGWPFMFGNSGYSQSPAASTMTYRWMERSPTIALAYSVARAPILAVPMNVVGDKKKAPKDADEKITEALMPQLPWLLKNMFRATSIRYSPFEILYGAMDDGFQHPTYFKPLLSELTQILITKDTGQFAGLRQGGDILGPNAFIYVNEPDKIPVYGYSRSENIRTDAWWPWLEANQRGGQLDKKAAGIVFSVLGPDGSTKYIDAAGNQVSAAKMSLDIANKLQQGISIYAPNKLSMAKGGMNPADLAKLQEISDFKIEYYDLGNTGPANESLLKKLQHYEALMFRGWHLPERSGLEGQHGTKAEAGEHAEFVDMDAEQMRADMAECITNGPINTMLQLNYGPKAVGTVKLIPAPVKDNRLVVLRMILDGLLKSGLAGAVAKVTDMQDLQEQLGIPRNDKVDPNDPENWVGPQPVDQTGKPVNGKPLNGNNGNGKQDKTAKQLARIGRWLGE